MSVRIMSVALIALPLLGNISTAKSLDFAVGKALFDRIWVPAPASTDAADGLGPLFNARSCVSCHPAGGRGRFEETNAGNISGLGLIVRIGNKLGKADPIYGTQLQTHGVQELRPEGIRIRTSTGALDAVELAYGPPAKGTKFGGRLATTLQGIGLLERIPAGTITAWADPEDTNRDDVSGRANIVQNSQGVETIGRFGWKAGKASLRDQSSAALHADLGLSNPLHTSPFGDCTEDQSQCRAAPHGASARFENLEVGSEMLRLMVAYVAGLNPPQPALENAQGFGVFTKTGCAECHRPNFPTNNGNQIKAYTDLLLHDMGKGLADGIGDGSATGTEWRTAPLWGLGKATRYLHDGRAKTLQEAIDWHAGEATKSKTKYSKLSKSDHNQLLKFLKGL